MKRINKSIARTRNSKVHDWVVDLAGIIGIAACMGAFSIVRILSVID